MEEPGSIDYVAEGEAMRIYGFIGCALYVLCMFLPFVQYCIRCINANSLLLHFCYLCFLGAAFVECIYLYSANANIKQTSGMRSLRI